MTRSSHIVLLIAIGGFVRLAWLLVSPIKEFAFASASVLVSASISPNRSLHMAARWYQSRGLAIARLEGARAR